MINLAMDVVELAGSLFQYADLESVMSHMSKEGMYQSASCRVLFIFFPLSYVDSVPAEDLNHQGRIDRKMCFTTFGLSYAVCGCYAVDPGIFMMS